MSDLSKSRKRRDNPRKRIFMYSSEEPHNFLRYLMNNKIKDIKQMGFGYPSALFDAVNKQAVFTKFLVKIEFLNIDCFFDSRGPAKERTTEDPYFNYVHDLNLDKMDKLFNK